MFTKYLDPKNDIAFKKIFGSEKNKDILIHFLNDMVLFREDGPIVDVTFLKTTQDPTTAAQKTSIVDVLCKDQKGNTYIVEMQVAKDKGFEKRAQYYAAKAYISQAHAGGAYQDLKEVIFIAIADFVMFPKKKSFKSDHVILDKESHEKDLLDFSFTFLELPKFHKEIDHLSNMIDKWVYFFKHADETAEQDLHLLVGNDPIIEKAYDELNRFSWNDQELLTYDQAEKYEWAYRASLAQKLDEGLEIGHEKGLKKGIEVGRQEGIEVGRQEGIEVGRQEGIEVGRQEGVELGRQEATLQVARTMLKKGVPLPTILEITGLSEEEINSLNNPRL